MTKEEHYEQAKKNILKKFNAEIARASHLTGDAIKEHPVVEIIEKENSLHQKTPFVVVRGVLRAFATSLPTTYDQLLKAMPEDADQKRWNQVLKAMLFARLIINKTFINEIIEAVQTDENIPANRVEQVVLAVIGHYTLLTWQLMKTMDSETMAIGFQQYDGLHDGLADLGRLQHVVPFSENEKMLEFHNWLQPVLSKYTGLEQSVLFNNLMAASPNGAHNQRAIGLSIMQTVVLYVNTYWVTQELNMIVDGGIRRAISLDAVDGILVRYTLNNIYQSYQSVGWLNNNLKAGEK